MLLDRLMTIPKGLKTAVDNADLVVIVDEDKSLYLLKCKFETSGRVIDEKEFGEMLKHSSFPLVVSKTLLDMVESGN